MLGLAVSPGKPLLSTVPCSSRPSTRGRVGSVRVVCQIELDVTCYAGSIATHVVLKQSLEYQCAQLNKALEKAKADVTEFTTLPVAGKPIFEGFRK